MKTIKEKDIKITVKSVSGREGEYIAFYTSDFLDATFSVYFNDNIMGAIALNNFSIFFLAKKTLRSSFVEFLLLAGSLIIFFSIPAGNFSCLPDFLTILDVSFTINDLMWINHIQDYKDFLA